VINLLSSRAASRSEDFKEVARTSGQDNVEWIKQNIKDGSDQTVLVMVGGKSPTSFRLRLAQSQVRTDLMPSYWSHVFMLDEAAEDFGATVIHEISLEPKDGFGFPVPENGVQASVLRQYAKRRDYPNVAVLNVADIKLSEVLESLKAFKRQRAVMDGPNLIVNWLAYLWGVARSPNPLLEGQGVPSAAMLEVVIGTCGFDLTPGLESRSSCPEAIWQAATWWHEYYEGRKKEGLSGAYFCPHQIK
jgi:hypothetical protein